VDQTANIIGRNGIGARVSAIGGKRQLLLAFSMGALLALVQAPWSQPLAFVFALPVLFWLHLGAANARRAAWIGWVAGLGYFGLSLSWLVEPFMVDAAREGWMAPFALFFMAAGLAAFWALGFGLATRGRILGFAGFWMLAEMARSYLFTGFPWGLIGYGWLDTPFMQTVAWIGVPGLGFATLVAMLLMARGLEGRWLQTLGGLAILLALWAGGAIRLAQPLGDRVEPFTVRLVQPNARQDLKWLPEFMPVFFQRQLDLSARGSNNPDLVVWPEAAVPFMPESRPDLLQQMARAANGAALVFGGRRVDATGRWYNTLFQIDATGAITAQYDKIHLVPFGEYIPFSAQISALGIDWLTGLTGTGFSAGAAPTVISAAGVPSYLPLICYEAIFAQAIPTGTPRPDWLLQITNDAWFGRFSGPYQHLAQARTRSIEQGLPLVRVANTGVSVATDARGAITAMLPLGVAGAREVTLGKALPATLYSRTGDAPALLVFLLAALSGFWRKRDPKP